MNGWRGACSHCLSPEVICSTDRRQYKGNKSLDRHSSDQMSFRHAHQLHGRTFLLASGRVSDVWRLNSSTKLPRPPKLSLCVFHPLPLFRCSSIFHSLRFSLFSFLRVFVSSFGFLSLPLPFFFVNKRLAESSPWEQEQPLGGSRSVTSALRSPCFVTETRLIC